MIDFYEGSIQLFSLTAIHTPNLNDINVYHLEIYSSHHRLDSILLF